MNSIDDLDFSKTYTYADYYSWRFEERLELIRGKIFKMSPAPGGNHQQIALCIASALFVFLEDKQCKVYTAPFDVRLVRSETSDKKIKTVVQPDVCVICDLTKMKDQRSCLGAPDIIVEVLSPGNSKKEQKIKYSLYEEFGVKEYWIIYPAERSLMKFVLNKEGKFILEGGPLVSGDKITSPILPGFELALDKVFKNLVEDADKNEY